ncbi:hypothetical protein EQG63_00700 [Flavobacterium amnicola]|uniref:Uncharacterized protein n=1 Tax=Flavobacterium amnicola TaxID=2506422 RepID=A0A4Q1K4J4_9FLAO|nr:hypothetical protein [Flavobacterium amnicola]RXR20482.1 hypothetical protein EQG63_00700 [Flavobacterium amnicola]
MSLFFLKWLIAIVVLGASILACYIYVITQKQIKQKRSYLERLSDNINSQTYHNTILNQKVVIADESNANLHNQILIICKEILHLQEILLKFRE